MGNNIQVRVRIADDCDVNCLRSQKLVKSALLSLMKAQQQIDTERLVLRKPTAGEAEAIFTEHAGDGEVTRYVGWPTHRSIADTRAFLAWSDSEWARWPAGPYLVLSRSDHQLLGGTGLALETDYRAMTGYVLAKKAWGKGYATEALAAMVELARMLGVRRLYALCHPELRPSWRVLEKCGFQREASLRRYAVFPNLASPEPCDTLCYARVF